MANPLLTETPVVTINGQQKNLPRLSLSSTFAIVGLIKEAATPEVIASLIAMQNDEASEFERGVKIVGVLLETIDNAEERIYKALAKILKIEQEQVEDLTLEEIVEVVIAFKDHPDVGFFTEKLPKMLKEMKNPLSNPMTR
ncbi:hypothetical protein ACFPRA_01350 [Sporosarcina soli]|uniref:Uncharacterized protein n=1 Tax=Sporosarcina soli TaxID=334736 RepID=A0ABW0TEF6_9BACL